MLSATFHMECSKDVKVFLILKNEIGLNLVIFIVPDGQTGYMI